jgi:general secretion pathway protein M
MSDQSTAIRKLTRRRAIAAAVYVAVVFVCAFMTWDALADIHERYDTLRAATDALDRIEGRKLSAGRANPFGAEAPAGSPFLEGQSITVAGAGLEQRVTGAIAKSGGSVLSTQVELNSSNAKKGFIGLIVSCELKQPALQEVLYDLEAGMPFLFIDQLEVQAPQRTGDENGAMRVLMTVSGQWRGKQ